MENLEGPWFVNKPSGIDKQIERLHISANEKSRIIKEIEVLINSLSLDWESKSYILGYLQVKSK